MRRYINRFNYKCAGVTAFSSRTCSLALSNTVKPNDTLRMTTHGDPAESPTVAGMLRSFLHLGRDNRRESRADVTHYEFKPDVNSRWHFETHDRLERHFNIHTVSLEQTSFWDLFVFQQARVVNFYNCDRRDGWATPQHSFPVLRNLRLLSHGMSYARRRCNGFTHGPTYSHELLTAHAHNLVNLQCLVIGEAPRHVRDLLHVLRVTTTFPPKLRTIVLLENAGEPSRTVAPALVREMVNDDIQRFTSGLESKYPGLSFVHEQGPSKGGVMPWLNELSKRYISESGRGH